jgi:peptidoglycan/xylan/chitin deacetylase (PgdA/CDA1 family)
MTSDSKFFISLDFELYWGVRDQISLKQYKNNIVGVRDCLPRILDLFEEFEIRATFATVGFLFFNSKKQLLSHLPKRIPKYDVEAMNPYNNYFDKVGESEEEDKYHFGLSLINQIKAKGHEIGTHTFSHFYCLEDGLSIDDFESDLVAALAVADQLDIKLKSIIFPRNQFTDEHLRICKKLGIRTYRGNESSRVYQWRKLSDEGYARKIIRFLDSYVNITGHHAFSISIDEGKLINIPASKFLRPYNPRLFFLRPLQLARIKKSMTYCASNALCYHLWWHPHNFGANVEANLLLLREILEHYRSLNKTYGFVSSTMEGVYGQSK